MRKPRGERLKGSRSRRRRDDTGLFDKRASVTRLRAINCTNVGRMTTTHKHGGIRQDLPAFRSDGTPLHSSSYLADVARAHSPAPRLRDVITSLPECIQGGMPSRSASPRAYVLLPEPELPKTRTLINPDWLRIGAHPRRRSRTASDTLCRTLSEAGIALSCGQESIATTPAPCRT
jgi:hypothetical protein